MTVLVGVRCSDGIVIGADSRATNAQGPQPLLGLTSNSKIQIVKDRVIVAGTGAVGLMQRLVDHVEQALDGNVFTNLRRREATTNVTTRALTDFKNSMVPTYGQDGWRFGALIGVVIKGEPCLVEYGTVDFQPEVKEGNLFFVSLGSGQTFADPFLAFISRVLWKGQSPDVETGKFGVYWALDHTIKTAFGLVGEPIKLAVLRKADAHWRAEELDTQEAAEYVGELEDHIGNFARATIEDAESTPPPAPPAA